MIQCRKAMGVGVPKEKENRHENDVRVCISTKINCIQTIHLAQATQSIFTMITYKYQHKNRMKNKKNRLSLVHDD